jgi:hypothetical protein
MGHGARREDDVPREESFEYIVRWSTERKDVTSDKKTDGWA